MRKRVQKAYGGAFGALEHFGQMISAFARVADVDGNPNPNPDPDPDPSPSPSPNPNPNPNLNPNPNPNPSPNPNCTSLESRTCTVATKSLPSASARYTKGALFSAW